MNVAKLVLFAIAAVKETEHCASVIVPWLYTLA
jgi:hypothetical protein